MSNYKAIRNKLEEIFSRTYNQFDGETVWMTFDPEVADRAEKDADFPTEEFVNYLWASPRLGEYSIKVKASGCDDCLYTRLEVTTFRYYHPSWETVAEGKIDTVEDLEFILFKFLEFDPAFFQKHK